MKLKKTKNVETRHCLVWEEKMQREYQLRHIKDEIRDESQRALEAWRDTDPKHNKPFVVELCGTADISEIRKAVGQILEETGWRVFLPERSEEKDGSELFTAICSIYLILYGNDDPTREKYDLIILDHAILDMVVRLLCYHQTEQFDDDTIEKAGEFYTRPEVRNLIDKYIVLVDNREVRLKYGLLSQTAMSYLHKVACFDFMNKGSDASFMETNFLYEEEIHVIVLGSILDAVAEHVGLPLED